MDNTLNIVIPACGYGRRFQDVGIWLTKPLIKVFDRTLIDWSVSSLGLKGNYIFIIREEDQIKFSLASYLRDTFGRCQIIQLKEGTEGAACTVLKATKYINNDNPLLVANCDQYIEWNPNSFFNKIVNFKADGGILTFNADHPKWSYVRLNDQELVAEVAEKKVISNHASVGVYYWKKGKYFVDSAKRMIDLEDRVNNEFYIAPSYNYCIEDGARIIHYPVRRMLGLGTPEDLEQFRENY